MRIYIATSFRVAGTARRWAARRRAAGHEVFDPTAPGRRSVVDGGDLPGLVERDWRDFRADPAARMASRQNARAIEQADVLLLLEPLTAGRSAHYEAGLAAGAGKCVVALQEGWAGGLRELVYLDLDALFDDGDDLLGFLAARAVGTQQRRRSAR